jgi:hypothetical protein
MTTVASRVGAGDRSPDADLVPPEHVRRIPGPPWRVGEQAAPAQLGHHALADGVGLLDAGWAERINSSNPSRWSSSGRRDALHPGRVGLGRSGFRRPPAGAGAPTNDVAVTPRRTPEGC